MFRRPRTLAMARAVGCWDRVSAQHSRVPLQYPFRADWDCRYRQSCRCDSLRFAHSSDFRVGRRHLHHKHVVTHASKQQKNVSYIAARPRARWCSSLSRVHDVRIRYFAAANRDGQKGAWICNGQGERIDHCLGLPRGGHAFSREEQGDGGHVNCLHLPHGRRTYQTHPGF